jgi:hypothetical protein
VLLWIWLLCLIHVTLLLPNLDWLDSALSCLWLTCCTLKSLAWRGGWVNALSNSRIRINLDCHVLRVQTCQSCMVCSFSTEPDSAVQLYSVIPSRVKRVHELDLNNVCFERSMFGLYHAVDWSILGRWCDFKQVVSCGGLTCLMSCSTGLKVPRHAVD